MQAGQSASKQATRSVGRHARAWGIWCLDSRSVHTTASSSIETSSVEPSCMHTRIGMHVRVRASVTRVCKPTPARMHACTRVAREREVCASSYSTRSVLAETFAPLVVPSYHVPDPPPSSSSQYTCLRSCVRAAGGRAGGRAWTCARGVRVCLCAYRNTPSSGHRSQLRLRKCRTQSCTGTDMGAHARTRT